MSMDEHRRSWDFWSFYSKVCYTCIFLGRRSITPKCLRIILSTWFILYILEITKHPQLCMRLDISPPSHLKCTLLQLATYNKSPQKLAAVGGYWLWVLPGDGEESYSQGFILEMGNVKRGKDTDLFPPHSVNCRWVYSILNSAFFQSLTNRTALWKIKVIQISREMPARTYIICITFPHSLY